MILQKKINKTFPTTIWNFDVFNSHSTFEKYFRSYKFCSFIVFVIDGIISLESYWYMTVRAHGAQNYYNPMFMTLSFVTYCGHHST